MAELKRVVPVLKVRDLQETIEFYSRHFGFELCWRAPNDGGGDNCMLKRDGISMMFSTGSHLGDKPQFSGTLYIDMDGVDAFYAKVKDAVPLVWPLEVMDYGSKEFGVRDPDGYVIAFSEVVSK